MNNTQLPVTSRLFGLVKGTPERTDTERFQVKDDQDVVSWSTKKVWTLTVSGRSFTFTTGSDKELKRIDDYSIGYMKLLPKNSSEYPANLNQNKLYLLPLAMACKRLLPQHLLEEPKKHSEEKRGEEPKKHSEEKRGEVAFEKQDKTGRLELKSTVDKNRKLYMTVNGIMKDGKPQCLSVKVNAPDHPKLFQLNCFKKEKQADSKRCILYFSGVLSNAQWDKLSNTLRNPPQGQRLRFSFN